MCPPTSCVSVPRRRGVRTGYWNKRKNCTNITVALRPAQESCYWTFPAARWDGLLTLLAWEAPRVHSHGDSQVSSGYIKQHYHPTIYSVCPLILYMYLSLVPCPSAPLPIVPFSLFNYSLTQPSHFSHPCWPLHVSSLVTKALYHSSILSAWTCKPKSFNTLALNMYIPLPQFQFVDHLTLLVVLWCGNLSSH